MRIRYLVGAGGILCLVIVALLQLDDRPFAPPVDRPNEGVEQTSPRQLDAQAPDLPNSPPAAPTEPSSPQDKPEDAVSTDSPNSSTS